MKRFLVIPIFLILVLSLVSPVLASDTQKYEEYSDDDDAAVELYGNTWGAQTFTTGTTAHTVSSIRLQLYREGTPSTVTVSIRETDTGDPSGTDLTSGTLDGDDFTDGTGGVWYSFNLVNYSLEASTMYAIAVRAIAGDAANSVHWRSDASAGAEANGQEETSANGGITWTGDADDDFMFEVWGEPVIFVESAQVFVSYYEEDDMVFVLEYKNSYPPYYPSDTVSSYFDIQLRNAAGDTVLHQTVCKSWGNKPGSIYISADSAASLTPGSAYRIYLYGDFGANPETYYTLTGADWRGDDLTYLDSWIISTAHNLEEYYNTTFTTMVSGKGEVLNEEGGIIFATGIPSLTEVRPDIFKVIVHVPTYDPEDWTNNFTGFVTWQDQVGPYVTTMLNNGGDLVNLDGNYFGAMLLFMGYIAFAVLVLGREHVSAGLALGVPVVLFGAWLRLIDILLVGVALAILSLVFVWHFWWSKT